jgi:hypothetical protein
MTMTIASAVAPAVWKVFVALMIAVCFGFRPPDPQLDPAGFGSSSLDRRATSFADVCRLWRPWSVVRA